MWNHPDIFEEEELKKGERGRNTDFTKEYYIKHKEAQIEVLKDEINEKVEEYLQEHWNPLFFVFVVEF